MGSDQELYNELSYYTLSLRDPDFIHQYAVDAFAAQHADEHAKPIKIAFALMGLYLCNEKGYSGRAVQIAHMQVAKKKRQLPTFLFPVQRGEMTVADVLRAAPGEERNNAIRAWSASVWDAWKDSHRQVADWIQADLGL